MGGKAAQVCGSELAWKQGMNHLGFLPFIHRDVKL